MFDSEQTVDDILSYNYVSVSLLEKQTAEYGAGIQRIHAVVVLFSTDISNYFNMNCLAHRFQEMISSFPPHTIN